MRIGFLAAVGFALVLAGCGGDGADSASTGSLVIQVQSGLLFNQAEVELNREDGTGAPSTIVLNQVGSSWLGSQDELAPGFYLAQLRVLHSSQAPPMNDVGVPLRVEVVSGATAEAKWLLGGDQTDPMVTGPTISQISMPSRQIESGSTITILMGVIGPTGTTLSGSAPSNAGFFGVPNGLTSIPFTAGAVAGSYPLTLTAEAPNGLTDSVVFDIEVVASGGVTPGELSMVIDVNSPPHGTIVAESIFTDTSVTVNFTLGAAAFGPASGSLITWKLDVEGSNAANTTACKVGRFSIGGSPGQPAPVSGLTTSGVSVTYTLDRPFGVTRCDFIYTLEDSLQGTYEGVYRLDTRYRTVTP